MENNNKNSVIGSESSTSQKEENSISLTFIDYQDRYLTVDTFDDEILKIVVDKLCEKYQIKSFDKFSFYGQTLDIDKTFGYYNITKNDVIEIVMQKQISLFFIDGNKFICYDVLSDTIVGNIYNDLCALFNLDQSNFDYLKFGDRILFGDNNWDYYNITNEDIIEIIRNDYIQLQFIDNNNNEYYYYIDLSPDSLVRDAYKQLCIKYNLDQSNILCLLYNYVKLNGDEQLNYYKIINNSKIIIDRKPKYLQEIKLCQLNDYNLKTKEIENKRMKDVILENISSQSRIIKEKWQKEKSLLRIIIYNSNSSRSFSIECPSNALVEELLVVYCAIIGVLPTSVALIDHGSNLDIKKTLEENNITSGDTIHVVNKIRGGASIKVSLISLNIDIDPINIINASISNLNNAISKLFIYNQFFIEYFIDEKRERKIIDDQDLILLNSNNKEINDNNAHYAIYYNVTTEKENYMKISQVGKGSFGKVMKYIELQSKKIIALKKIKDLDEFNKELNIFYTLKNHERIVRFEKHIKTKDNKYYIVMEYMAGGSLRSYLDLNGALPELKIKILAKHILEGLQYLHGKNIMHRDLKSENILLDELGNAKLCDFGQSKILIDISGKNFKNNKEASNFGTFRYMAPEAIKEKKYSFPADVWSFGAVMVEMVTGLIPYPDIDERQALIKIAKNRKIEFSNPKNGSKNLKSFINTCLKSNPSERSDIFILLQHNFIIK